MGLDIFFFRYKRSEYDRLNEDTERWKDTEPESRHMSTKDYVALSDDERKKVDSEIADWYNEKPDSQEYSEQEIGYFRKANFLTRYFDYYDNSTDQEVTADEFMDLLARCRAILKHNSKTKAELLLPTESGFFFGSQEYDEYYFNKVRDCRELCKKVIKEYRDYPEDEYITILYCNW